MTDDKFLFRLGVADNSSALETDFTGRSFRLQLLADLHFSLQPTSATGISYVVLFSGKSEVLNVPG